MRGSSKKLGSSVSTSAVFSFSLVFLSYMVGCHDRSKVSARRVKRVVYRESLFEGQVGVFCCLSSI